MNRRICILFVLLAASCARARADFICGTARDDHGPAAKSVIVITNAAYTLTVEERGRVCGLKISPAEYSNWVNGVQSSTEVRAMAQRIYNHFQDVFDFIIFVNDESSQGSGYSGIHYGVKNDVQGIGKSIFNNTSLYGSTGSLQSVIHLRQESQIRGGPSLHEICHRWANSLSDIPDSGSHWGFAGVGGQLGGWAPGTLSNVVGITWDANGPSGGTSFGTIANGGNGVPYSELELYVMGLISQAATTTGIDVAQNAGFTDSANGIFTSAVIQAKTITNIVATQGARVPAAGSSQTNFRSVLVVLSDEFTTSARWDQFNSDASNFCIAGSDGSSVYNFWEATGGRATIKMDDLFAALQSDELYAAVSPATDFESEGFVGGPFAPTSAIYTVSNPGSLGLLWRASATQAWVSVAPTGGLLAAGGTVLVTAMLTAAAANLPGGTYLDTFAIFNASNGIATTRDIQLTVNTVADLPFAETFESGAFASYWKVTGENEYRTEVTTANGPSNSYHVTMDDSVSGSLFSRNELTLTINLTGCSNVVLAFWAKEFLDEADGPPSTPFTNSANFDGVAISESATASNWYEIQGLRTLTTNYQQFVLSLDGFRTTHGLAYSGTFRIRFNQYDNFPVSGGDGIAIDNISITGASPIVLADIAVAKTSDASHVVGGTDLAYFITVTNRGPAAASSVIVVDALPQDVSFLSATGCMVAGGVVTCSVASLNAGAVTQFAVHVAFTGTAYAAQLTNTATVSTSSSDTNALNNAAAIVLLLDHDGDGIPTLYEDAGDGDGDGVLSYLDGGETFDLAAAALQAGGGMSNVWISISGAVYQLQAATNILAGSWTNVSGVVTASGSMISVVDTNGSGRSFYRVILQQLP